MADIQKLTWQALSHVYVDHMSFEASINAVPGLWSLIDAESLRTLREEASAEREETGDH